MKLTYQPGQLVRRPEDMWDVDAEFFDAYHEHVEFGRNEARRQKIAIVAICRNAMPWMKNTLTLVEELVAKFAGGSFYAYENDSTDDTAGVLDDFALRQWVTVEHDTLGGADSRGFEPERTHRLAKCRSRCQAWVKERAVDANYVAVLDIDPHGGFSVDGVLNSLGWFCDLFGSSTNRLEPGAMASYSLLLQAAADEPGKYGLAQYDAWAARLNWWNDYRVHDWFHALLPPVGAPPIPMNSAFGGLCLYTRQAYMALEYAGGDCEHVLAHRAMRRGGFQCYLNPGSRYVALIR